MKPPTIKLPTKDTRDPSALMLPPLRVFPLLSFRTQYRALLETASDVIVSQDGEIVLVNLQTEKLFGYKREDLLNRPTEILMPERFRSRHSAHRNEFVTHHRVCATGGR
jgi:PAS domain-containing protein